MSERLGIRYSIRPEGSGKKLIEFCERIAEKPDCDLCRKLLEAYNEKPSCKDCIPDLLPENQAIYTVYSRVCGQHIMGQAGPVDLKLEPVFKIMDLVGIKQEDQLFCIDIIQKAYHSVLKKQREKKS